MTCETCTHRVETTCHRYPPQLMQGHVRIWPTIAMTDWCGEWAAKFPKEHLGIPVAPNAVMSMPGQFVLMEPTDHVGRPWWRFWR